MAGTVLITGGAGFIGRHVAGRLLSAGRAVRVLDSFVEQVHGPDPVPDRLLDGAEVIHGDVRDADAVRRAVAGVDAVIHLAAEVGVGQSMYEIERYVDANERGTAVLFEALAANPVRRIVTASSMSVYGEGLYADTAGRLVESAARPSPAGPDRWDPEDADGTALTPVPTPEWKRPDLSSVYALGKFAQERMTMMLGAAYGMEPVALRLFNVYGPGQALSNPYTGVLAIFAARILNGEQPLIFEDGFQRRDFVAVEDVADAFVHALHAEAAAGEVLNVASGESRTIRSVAVDLARVMGRPDLAGEVTGRARAGDIRHCFADASLARDVLGFTARTRFEDGVEALARWLAGRTADDRVDEARSALEARGLVS